MRNFILLRKDLIVNLSRQIKLAFITLISGLLIIFLLSLIPSNVGKIISSNIFLISFIYGLLVVIIHFILLFQKAEKDPYRMLTFTDYTIIFKAKYHTDEYKIVGLAYVEVDAKSYPPGIMLNFIYNENLKISVLIHQKQYESFVYMAHELKIHFEEKET